MRRYDEQVQVRVVDPGDGSPARPDAFIWRDRLHVVTTVLASWLEREAWWEVDVRRGEPQPYERTVWRVEAGPGRWAGTGVYDIARTVPLERLVLAGSAGATAGVTAGATAGVTAAGTTAGAGGAGGAARTRAGAGDAGEWWLLCRLD